MVRGEYVNSVERLSNIGVPTSEKGTPIRFKDQGRVVEQLAGMKIGVLASGGAVTMSRSPATDKPGSEPSWDSSGAIAGVLCVGVDVTDRKRKE